MASVQRGGKNSETVKVIVRCRPLNSTEESNKNYRYAT
jgi:hypothetical protein